MSAIDGPTVEEVPVRLLADGAVLYEWRCTPADLTALVIGRLYIEGMIEDGSVVNTVEVGTIHDGVIDITIGARLQDRNMQHRTAATGLPDTAQFGNLFRSLFTAVDDRHESGGMHAAALADGGRIVFQAEDVGRHNAVDKVIGMALLARDDPGNYGMLISSRVSGEIARKAARAGVAWLASRSIPTSLAVTVAREASMPIVGRAAGKEAFIYR